MRSPQSWWRLLASLVVALLATLLGPGVTPSVAAVPLSTAVVYTYDSQTQTAASTLTTGDRGPPSESRLSTPYDAIGRWSAGTSVQAPRLSTSATSAAAGDDPSGSLRSATGTPSEQVQRIEAGPSWADRAGIAAKTESRVLSKVDDLPCNCFVAGTTVQTSKGAKPIEDVRPGDQVWAKNLTTGKNELRPVTGLFQKKSTTLMTIALARGATVVVTQEPPFMVEGEGWVLSGDLRVGDRLAQRDAGTAVITAIEVRAGGQTVYNFEVSGDHNYYITDAQLLVHNCAMQARPGALANAWGYSTKQIKAAIERVKQQATWRGDGANRNPDVLVDDVTGEVFPQVRGGTSAEDSIGNLFDHLPPGTR